MAEAAAKTVLDKISQGHLECPICCCLFKDPKMLDCLHSFCLKCLEEMMSKQKPEAEKITCPVCRRETQVPDGELQSLASSFFLSSLVDEVKQQEAVLGEASMPTATCDCGEGKEATWRCLDCSNNLCQECRKAHGRVKSTKDHQIISLGDWHKSKMPPAEHSKPITRMCTIHHDHPLYFYCDTCDTLICSMCAALDHRSAEHNFLKIDDLIRSFRSEVGYILQKFEKSRQCFKFTEKSIEHARYRLQKKLAQARSDIDAKAEAEITKIRNKAKILTDKVDKIGQERDSEYEKVLMHNREQIECAEQTIAAVNDLMSQVDDFELLELKPKVMRHLEFQKELKFEPVNHGPSFIGVRCQDVVSDAELGEVCVSEKWQLREEFCKEGTGDEEFQEVRDVACFTNGDIVVTDVNLERLSLFSSTGRYKTSVAKGDLTHQLEAPFGVAVTHDDLLFVTDQQKVKVFDTELQFVREFTPSADDADGRSESFPTAVAVDNQRVAVADWGRKCSLVGELEKCRMAETPPCPCNLTGILTPKLHILELLQHQARMQQVILQQFRQINMLNEVIAQVIQGQQHQRMNLQNQVHVSPVSIHTQKPKSQEEAPHHVLPRRQVVVPTVAPTSGQLSQGFNGGIKRCQSVSLRQAQQQDPAIRKVVEQKLHNPKVMSQSGMARQQKAVQQLLNV